MKLRRNDTVLIIAGKDRGKTGKVLRTLPREERLVVEGVSMVKRHLRRHPQATQAGIVERESPISNSDAMLLCAKCHRPTRVGFRFLSEGKKVRFCHSCDEVID